MKKNSQIKQVFIFCAGLGKRLMPLTQTTPKPLLPIKGSKCCLDYIVKRLNDLKFERIFINVHHLADKIIQHLVHNTNIIFSYEKQILETGGGLKKMRHYFQDTPMLVINSDIYWDNDSILSDFISMYNPRWPILLGLIETKNAPCGFLNGDYEIQKDLKLKYFKKGYKYSGIQIINPKIIDKINKHTFSMKEIFDFYENKQILRGVILDTQWYDIGTPECYKLINSESDKN